MVEQGGQGAIALPIILDPVNGGCKPGWLCSPSKPGHVLPPLSLGSMWCDGGGGKGEGGRQLTLLFNNCG